MNIKKSFEEIVIGDIAVSNDDIKMHLGEITWKGTFKELKKDIKSKKINYEISDLLLNTHEDKNIVLIYIIWDISKESWGNEMFSYDNGEISSIVYK